LQAIKKVNEGLNYFHKGAIAEINGNIKQALRYYKKACDLGVKGGCNSYKRLKNKK
jgi:TPR repeat protein